MGTFCTLLFWHKMLELVLYESDYFVVVVFSIIIFFKDFDTYRTCTNSLF